MLRFLLCLSLSLGSLVFAQAPFYTDLLDQARTKMERTQWAEAEQLLSDARFGLMQYPQLMGEIEVRQTLNALYQAKDHQKPAARAMRILGDAPTKPEGLRDTEWRVFLKTMGLNRAAQAAPAVETPVAVATKEAAPPKQEAVVVDTPKPEPVPVKESKSKPVETVVAKKEAPAKPGPVKTVVATKKAPAKALPEAELAEDAAALFSRWKQNRDDLDLGYAALDAFVVEGSLSRATNLLKRLGDQDNGDARYADAYALLYYERALYRTVINTFGSVDPEVLGEQSLLYLGLSLIKRDEVERGLRLLAPLKDKHLPVLHREAAEHFPAPKQKIKNVEPVFLDPIGLPETVSKAIALLDQADRDMSWPRLRELTTAALAQWPGHQDLRYYQARVWLRDGRYAQAGDAFYKLVALGYQQREIFFHGGMAFYHQKDYAKANYWFSRALSLNSIYAEEIEQVRATYRKRKAVAGN